MNEIKESKIAIIIKTAPNRKSLLWLLNSIKLSLKDVNYRVYLADEKPVDEWKIDLYKKLQEQGNFIKIWDKPIAVTIARNHLIDQLQDEDYVLRVDDDFELGGEFNINALLAILEGNNDVDFCCDIERQIGKGKKVPSGDLRIQSGHLRLHDNFPPVIRYKHDNTWQYNEVKQYRFAKADYMRNLILLKRHCFYKVNWNENLFFTGEHLDFFLSLKKVNFQGAFTPDSIHLHRDDLKYSMLKYSDDKDWRKKDKKENMEIEFKEKWHGVPQKKMLFNKRKSNFFKKFLALLKE